MIKICTKCKIEKNIEEFSKWKHSKDDHFHQCKKCCKEYNKIYREKNKNKLNENNKEYYKEYYNKYKDKIKENHKIDYIKYKEKWKSTRKKYYEKNKSHLLEIQKKRLENPLVRKNRNKTARIRDEERSKTDINYKIKKRLRCRIWHALKGIYKTKRTEELIGCKYQEFIKYLESKFQIDMTWDNYGKWHIDHIIPCDAFDLSLQENQEKCFHYTNLQPLWAKDNLLKSNKII